ncbi:sialate O-acetylesterase [Pedobacter sp.]|uniref:sialate O-acetylesterase n=1 Tax=Pedobacter sp. TaxID=1411316 RepID=UPI003D7FE3DA
MNSIKYLLIFCLALNLTNHSYSAVKDSLSLADALQNNMVLQQNKAFKVWGKANAGEKISITADWMANPIIVIAANNGIFEGMIAVPQAKRGDFSSHYILVGTKKEKKKLINLLIGDVWFCSGQSNMQFAVKEMTGAADVISKANQPHIRLLNVELNFSKYPIDTFAGKWQECSGANVKGFSAVGYTFGRKLYDELNIPIGIIFSGIGASGVQAYLPQDVLANNSLLNQTYLQPYLDSLKAKEEISSAFSFEKVVRPFLLYNAMIHPFINLSIKGFCWYQGESNHMERIAYVEAMHVMIKEWRTRFKQADLPFYYVQIAPFAHEKEDVKLTYDAFFREAQGQIAELNNTKMICTMDVGEAKNLHPTKKEPIGHRLAAVALNRTYHQLSVTYMGPTFSHAIFQKEIATIYFKQETLSGGLNTSDGQAPAFFFVAGDDQIFYPAIAKIINNTIVVTSDKVIKPRAVRYAFFNYPVTNLQNSNGFPALPFRTDDWPEPK